MNGLRMAGATWIAVAIMAVATTFIFRNDAGQILATTGLAVATAVVGLWMLARGEAVSTRVAVVAGASWFVLYGGLALLQSTEVAAWVTDAFLAAVGVGVALLAWAVARHRRDAPTLAREA